MCSERKLGHKLCAQYKLHVHWISYLNKKKCEILKSIGTFESSTLTKPPVGHWDPSIQTCTILSKQWGRQMVAHIAPLTVTFPKCQVLRKNGLHCTLHCEIAASSITIATNLACCLVSTHSFISFIFSICHVAAFRSYWHFEIRMSRVGARTQPIVGISIVCGLDLQSANIVRVNYNGLHATKDVRLLSSSAYVRRVHSTSLRAALYDFL